MARTRLQIPIAPHIQAIVCMSSIFSVGNQTFIFAQRLAPVNIDRKRKKNPRNQNNPRTLYETNAKQAIMRMRVVNFIENAIPMIIPVRPSR
jgi:hypothetical protein